jgi:uncharacterized membrane protein YfcA
MSLVVLVALGVVGLLVGFLSGLIGIGGGVLIVPFLYFFYAHPSWSGTAVPEELLVTMAHATSLFIIVPTAMTGTLTFSRARLVAWQAAVPIALFSVAAAAMGATLAVEMPADALSFAFGLFLAFTGFQMIGTKPRTEAKPMRLQLWITSLTGTLVGFLSATLGVGGGLVAIPMLLYAVRLDVARVAATSLAVVGLAALSGTITYVVNGVGLPARPPGSFGFVHASAALPILLGSMFAVRWGARANQRVNRKVLRWLFGGAFILMGLRLAWQSGVRLFVGG